MRARRLGDIERCPRICGLAADVQKQRAVLSQCPCGELHPFARPLQVTLTRQRVVVAAITNAEVVGGRCDDDVERVLRKRSKNVERVPEVKPKSGAAELESGVGLGGAGHRWLIVGGW